MYTYIGTKEKNQQNVHIPFNKNALLRFRITLLLFRYSVGKHKIFVLPSGVPEIPDCHGNNVHNICCYYGCSYRHISITRSTRHNLLDIFEMS